MTDLRALCARMADELDHYRQVLMGDRRETHALAAEARAALEATADCNYPSCVDDSPDERCSRWLVGDCPGPCNPDRARTALAQPEPPADGEAAELVAWLRTNADYASQKAATATFKRFHHAADLLERLAQPESQGPTDEELDSAFHEHCWTEDDLMDHDDFVKAARAVLARWGRPATTGEQR